MKKSLSLIILAVSYFSVNGQSLWKVYKPAQDNIVGWTVDYKSSTIELRKKQNKLDSMTTSESTESYDKYTKTLNIDVIAVSRKVGKITTIQPMGDVYIDQAYILKPPVIAGATYVHSAIRADSCKVTFVKDASTNVNPMELINGIGSAFGVTAEWIKVNWIDSVKKTFKDSVSVTIKKPNVYFLVGLAKLKKPGINIPFAQRLTHPEYYKTFNGINANKQQPITLDPDSEENSSASCETEGVNPTCKVTIFVDKDEQGKTQLYAITNFDNYDKKLIKPNVGNKWDITDLSLGLFNTQGNIYVELKIDVKAVRVGNKIKINESYMTYPKYSMVNQ